MPLSRIYGKIVGLRNRLYDREIFDTFHLGAKTISVGNLTTGGTGKTPLTAYIAQQLATRGERVCILTRGYGRHQPGRRVLVSDGDAVLAGPEIAGDEPVELARKLLGQAIVIADRDRVAAAEWAKRKFDVTVFLLDDGFQHRRALRDLDIVCIDATNPWGGGKMLPAGRLREPIDGLARATAVVITRSDLVENIDDIRSEISRIDPNAPIFMASTEIVRITELGEFLTPSSNSELSPSLVETFRAAAGKSLDYEPRVAAFCGLGNPESFFKQISRAGNGDLKIPLMRSLPDHHIFTQADIDSLEAEAKLLAADVLATTAKDAVKLKDLEFSLPCFVIEIGVVLDDPDGFSALL